MKCDSFEHDEMMQYQNTKIKQKKIKKIPHNQIVVTAAIGLTLLLVAIAK